MYNKCLFTIWVTIVFATTASAYTRQEAIDAIAESAHAYWDQRAVIEGHANGRSYDGFSGNTTVIETGKNRYYFSDSGWMGLPHIFIELEDSPGHAGMLFAYADAYAATGNKFLMRCAKSLGDTLLQAQADNEGTGWWQDMGVWAYDDVPGSSTRGQRLNYGAFVNWVPYSGREAYQTNRQNLVSNDGCSPLAAYALLKLYQVLPISDPDRDNYLNGAKAYADTIVDLKDVHETTWGDYFPYGNGGVPQIWPWETMSRINPGYEAAASYPYPIPHNSMVTLNDDAMTGAIIFLIAFYKEALTNANLDADTYKANIRLHVDYLISVFNLNALANGRSSWSSFYWINDGSLSANKPTWGRSYEPPSYSAIDCAQDVLVAWHLEESDTTRRAAIAATLDKWCLFWKYEVPRLNDPSEPFAAKIESTGSDPCPYYQDGYTAQYDASNPWTWFWWIWVNHETGANHLQWVSATNTHDVYTPFYGMDALESDPTMNYRHSYPTVRGANNYRSVPGRIMSRYWDEDTSTMNYSGGQFDTDFRHQAWLRFFVANAYNTTLIENAIADLATNGNGFFSTGNTTIKGTDYTTLSDGPFIRNVTQLAWGALNGSGTVSDSDGDGYLDADETAAGGDPLDSESYPSPSSTSPPNSDNGGSGGCFIEKLF